MGPDVKGNSPQYNGPRYLSPFLEAPLCARSLSNSVSLGTGSSLPPPTAPGIRDAHRSAPELLHCIAYSQPSPFSVFVCESSFKTDPPLADASAYSIVVHIREVLEVRPTATPKTIIP